MKTLLPNITLAVISLLFFLFLGEVALRWINPHDQFYPSHPSMNVRYANVPILAGVTDTVTIQTNSLGLRNFESDISASTRYVVLGGSTSFCHALSQDELWTKLLQDSLRARRSEADISILNAGISGLNSGHHVFQLEDYLPRLGPLDGVIILMGINDFNRAFKLQDKFYPSLEDERLIRKAFVKFPREYGKRWYQKLELWLHLRDFDQTIIEPYSEKTQEQKTRIYRKFLHQDSTMAKTDHLVLSNAMLGDYKNNIEKIISHCKAAKLPLVFITQPTSYAEHDDRDPRIVNGARKNVDSLFTDPALYKGMAIYNDILRSAAKEEGVSFIDAAELLAKDTSVFYDYCHFNPSGSRKLASLIYKHWDQLGW